MGTFHPHAHPLHGITCVVDLGERVAIGRLDTADERTLVLVGADAFEGTGPARERFVEKAARLGVWPRHERLVLAAADVRSVRRLSEVAAT